MKDLISKKTAGPARKREAMRYLVEVHALPLRRSCGCVVCLALGLVSSSPWTGPCAMQGFLRHWPGWLRSGPAPRLGMCRKHLRRTHPCWNHKHIYRVKKAMRLNLPGRRRVGGCAERGSPPPSFSFHAS